MAAFDNPYAVLALRMAIDIAAMVLLLFGIYYRRYRDKELVTAAALFNVFIFGVLSVLSNIEFSVSAGFGLFAILALFTLRSEQISKIEISYFFGSVAIAVISSVHGSPLPLVAAIVALLLAGAYLIDHPRTLRSVSSVKVTLDRIERHTLTDPPKVLASLSAQLGVQVMSYQVTAIDYINDMARLDVHYRKH